MTNARFSVIPAWIITHGELKGSDLKVVCLLGIYTNREGWCRRSQVKMAQQLNCGRSTVQDSLARLVQIGAVERRVVDSIDGRDSAHWYRVVLDRAVQSDAFDAWDAEDAEEFGPISEADIVTPPAGVPAPPAGPGAAPPAGSGPAPINEHTLTIQSNEGEKERERGAEEEESPRALERRFRAWFAQMPGYLDDSEMNARREWQALTPAQRAECERLTPIWLKERERIGRTKPTAASTYLAERRWERVPDAVTAVTRKPGKIGSDQIAVAPFGPVWAGKRMMALLDGPVDFELPEDLLQVVARTYEAYSRTNRPKAEAFLAERGIVAERGQLVFPDGFWTQERQRRVSDVGYPEVNRLHKLAVERGKEMEAARFAVLKDLCEGVPIGCDLYERWKAYHHEMNWPWLPDHAGMNGVWFPKGGPEGLGEFEIAARAALAMERGDDAA